MKINEIFASIQGEGQYQGLPTVFTRLQGCNLLPNFCTYCDTSYAQLGDSGEELTVEGVIQRVDRLSPRSKSWICITGGEPLRQIDELEELVRELKRQQYLIEIETNGSLPKPRWWTLVDSWCADIKCPSSGVVGISKEEWFKTRPKDQIKFVVGTEEDLVFADQMIRKHLADNPVVLISPVINLTQINPLGKEDYFMSGQWLQRVVEFCLKHRVQFSLQWHKVVFGNKRGV
ncbi:hypothetical protein LCGC14_1631150 [marine sediment metagenome]|uniref:Radical SAM core domain-containing protein n=1 Tax=marine sediment metagenome TaxID=412755 RepID=A0A0F9KI53_9ZZZZ